MFWEEIRRKMRNAKASLSGEFARSAELGQKSYTPANTLAAHALPPATGESHADLQRAATA
ncbi:MAG: hypothetical protein EBY81_03880, partial [Verrucomicrobia bacterium]|nr:hypothetical protein [Verrucomicrobiota bacterium]